MTKHKILLTIPVSNAAPQYRLWLHNSSIFPTVNS